MFFYTPEEVRRIEKNETENGLSSLEMIENAAAALYDRFKECFEANRKPMRVLVLCGKGNNGADGYAFAKLLKKDGIFTEILSVNTGTQSRENRFFSQNAAVLETKPDFSKYDCIADGVYGSGFTGELPEEIGNLFDDIRRSAVPVFAIDLPSGVHGADGTVSSHALPADFTVNLTARKVGSYVFPGAGLCGKVFLGAELPAPPSSFKDGFFAACPSFRTHQQGNLRNGRCGWRRKKYGRGGFSCRKSGLSFRCRIGKALYAGMQPEHFADPFARGNALYL